MNNQKQSSHHWLRLPILLLVAVMAVALLAATALAEESTSDSTAVPAVPTVPTPAPAIILIGATSNGEINRNNDDDDDDDNGGGGELSYQNEDILGYDPATDTWSVFFDGTARGLGPVNVEDFEYDPATQKLYFTINNSFSIPNPNGAPNPLLVKDSDIVEYSFVSNSFSIFKTGASFGLVGGNEDIDALAMLPNGHLLISTIGSVQANGASGKDEDVLDCDPSNGQCVMHMDNSDIALTSGGEDTTALWADPDAPLNHALAFKSSWRAQGSQNSLSGKQSDVLGCSPLGALGNSTDCYLYSFFKGRDNGFRGHIDGLWVSFAPIVANVVQSAAVSAEPTVDSIDEADYNETVSMGDEEIDAYDFIAVARQVFLPAAFKR